MKNKKALSVMLAVLLVFATVSVADAMEMPDLIPGGNTVGLQISTDGALIVGLNSTNQKSPAQAAGLHGGDIITHIGSEKIDSVEEVQQIISESNGKTVSVRVSRNGKLLQFEVTPVTNEDGDALLGVWLRDAVAGIGTLTFINPATNEFGALGHSVSDADTGSILPIKDGKIMPAEVTSVIKGTVGEPGQLQGNFNPSVNSGVITRNTANGIFGYISTDGARNAIPTAEHSEISIGAAKILTAVDGTEVREYDIEISRVYPLGEERNMLITVTDPELISKTGGIVQGMSGSPIIQNGKLIGAVTHVLISDPQKGYGISLEQMLS